jgi:hypothetical protein
MLKRVIAGLLGVPLLLLAFYEAYLLSFGFYEKYWTIPIEKIGVRWPLRWQDIFFVVAAWSILLMLFYVSYRLVKYAFRSERDAGGVTRLKWRTIAIVATVALLIGMGFFELKAHKRRTECRQRNAAFGEQIESIKQDARARLKRGTKRDEVRKFFADHNIPFHSTKSDVSGEIYTSGCAPTGCGSDAALIGIRVELDADGSVRDEPIVVGLYTNCV